MRITTNVLSYDSSKVEIIFSQFGSHHTAQCEQVKAILTPQEFKNNTYKE